MKLTVGDHFKWHSYNSKLLSFGRSWELALPTNLPSGASSLTSKFKPFFGGVCQPAVRLIEPTPVRSRFSKANHPSPPGKRTRLLAGDLYGVNPFIFSL